MTTLAETPVRVFKNHKHGCYTILQGSRALASARQVRIADVEFVVRASGRKRMLDVGRRTIHAYAVGRLIDFVLPGEPCDLTPVVGQRAEYHPHRYDRFYDLESEDLLIGAHFVQLDEQGIIYSGGIYLPGARAA